MTTMTRPIVSSIVNCTSRTAARVVCERSDIRSTWIDGGSDCSRCGITALTRSTTAIVLAPGDFWIAIPSASLVAEPGNQPSVLHRVEDVADILDAYRRAVLVGDDDVAVLRGVEQLIVGIERDRLMLALDSALGPVDGCGRDSALRTSSRPMPRAASAPGLIWTRAA